MIKVYAGGTLMVLGLIALIGMPTAGVVMIGAGYWIFQRASPGERHQASSLFWGCTMVCMLLKRKTWRATVLASHLSELSSLN